MGRSCRFLQGPDTDFLTVRRIADAVSRFEEVNVQILNYKKGGQPFWNSLYLAPVSFPAALDGSRTSGDSASQGCDGPTLGSTGKERPLVLDAATAATSRHSPSRCLYIGLTSDVTLPKILLARHSGAVVGQPTHPFRPLSQPPTLVLQPCRRPMTIQFTDVCYSVAVPGVGGGPASRKQVLQRVSGSAVPGRLLAVMGSSGCGKTTLLSVLAGRVLSGVSGTLHVNGLPFDKQDRRRVGFVMQDDVMFSNLTVTETLMYIAQLRLPASQPLAEKVARVQEIISVLQLEACANTRIGNAFSRGVSGGERKRVSIGIELLTDPSVLFLDEPTSGLDSSTALTLVHCLKALAASGRTVVTSIHQPSSQIFCLFDTLLLMSKGHAVYFGPAADAVTYFACPPLRLVCPTLYNPADYFMEITNASQDQRPLVEAWKAEEEAVTRETREACPVVPNPTATCPDAVCVVVDDHVARDRVGGEGAAGDAQGLEGAAGHRTSSCGSASGSASVAGDADADFGLDTAGSVSHRLVAAYSKRLVDARLVQSKSWRRLDAGLGVAPAPTSGGKSGLAPSVGGGAGVGKETRWPVGFWAQLRTLASRSLRQYKGDRLGGLMLCQHLALAAIASWVWFQLPANTANIKNKSAMLFHVVVYWGFSSLFNSLSTFPGEIAVLRRERAGGLYRLSAYFFAKSAADLPLSLAFPFMHATITYWFTGLQRTASAYLLHLLVMFCNVFAAEAMGLAISASVSDFKRSMVLASVIMLAIMLLNGFLSDNVPPSLSWLPYLGFATYSYTAMMQIEFSEHRVFPCVNGNSYGYGECPVTGKRVVDALASDVPLYANILVVIGMALAFRYAAYLALRRRTRVV